MITQQKQRFSLFFLLINALLLPIMQAGEHASAHPKQLTTRGERVAPSPLDSFIPVKIKEEAHAISTNAQHTEHPLDTNKWVLIWSDEFDYTGLPDTNRWNYDTLGNAWGWGNYESQWYTSAERKNAYVSDGRLCITALKEDAHDKQFTSARLTTKNKGDWKYVRIDVAAKLPAAKGTWSAIWMLPTEQLYGTWPHSGEIDIMEHVGYTSDTVFSTIHTASYNHLKKTQVGASSRLENATNHYHRYTLEWEEDVIHTYVEDSLCFTFRNEKKTFKEWPFDQPFHLILNLAVGGALGGRRGIDEAAFPQLFEIDYVRVYKRKSADE